MTRIFSDYIVTNLPEQRVLTDNAGLLPFRAFLCLIFLLFLIQPELPAQGDNVRFGDLRLNLTANAGQTYDSNIGRAPNNEVHDWITHLGLTLTGTWSPTEINDLRLRIGLQYRKYWLNPELDSHRNFIILTPDTEVAFLVQAGNFSFRIYDNLSFESDPGNQRFIDPQTGDVISNIFSYNRFQNQVGIDGVWQFNPFWSAQMGISRLDIIPLDSEFRALQRDAHIAYLGLTHNLASNMDVGTQTSVSINRWRTDFQPASRAISLSGFVRWQPTQNLETEASLAWTHQRFDAGADNQDTTREAQGLGGSLTVRHFATPVIEHSITYSRQLDLGTVSNLLTIQSVEYELLYSGFERSTIHFGVGWNNGVESGGLNRERFERWVFRTGLSYELSSQLNFSAGFQHSLRDSNLPARNYHRNLLTLEFTYDF